jgi:hypothetical protein
MSERLPESHPLMRLLRLWARAIVKRLRKQT